MDFFLGVQLHFTINQEMKIEAPCQIGDVLIYDILGLDSDLIITKAIDKFDS